MAAPETTGYTRLQIALHWLIALLILFQFLVHDGMEEAWRAQFRGGEGGNPWPHIVVGSLVLILAAIRLVLRLTKGAPPHPAGQHPALGLVAKIVHGLIYALIFIMPLSGLAAWFGGAQQAAMGHSGPFKTALIALILVHIAGALVQQFVFRSGVIRRMMKARAS